MRELLRTNDLVLLSFLETALASQGIEAVVLDVETSALDGMAFGLARRLMVEDADLKAAAEVLQALRQDYGPL